MKKQFTEDQILSILKESESGKSISELCEKYEIAQSTYYKWQSKYNNLNILKIKNIKHLQIENQRLKQMYMDLVLEHQALKEIIEKKSFSSLIEDKY
jgi:putative transposase